MQPKTVKQAYQILRIPQNLQEHHLRVAAIVQIATNHWKEQSINARDVVLAALFHDTANILKFDFSNTAIMGTEAGNIEYWQNVQKEVKEKYGSDIHAATLAMDQEIGLPKETLRIIDGLEWDRVEEVLKQQDWPVALAIYADMRIGPFGILSIQERIGNLHARRPMENYKDVLASALTLESTLQSHVNIKLNEITDDALSSRFTPLLNQDF